MTLKVSYSHITDFHVLLIVEGRWVITSSSAAPNFGISYKGVLQQPCKHASIDSEPKL